MRAHRRAGNGGKMEIYGVICIAKTLNSLEIINVCQRWGM
jgi:hypothetical protein